MTTIILGISVMLMMSALEAFILEKKISELHFKKIQSFYAAEASLNKVRGTM